MNDTNMRETISIISQKLDELESREIFTSKFCLSVKKSISNCETVDELIANINKVVTDSSGDDEAKLTDGQIALAVVTGTLIGLFLM
ncbi:MULTISPECIES: hypothetical protein [Vibrio]|uniref:hypothetical protein n=1 Tax=Vibrio TaxID=662 RepID=UPI0005EFC0A4|nr:MULTISPECIES: hypothetical protein [Vibrio]KJR33184.1 hypothetical protein UF06_06550 [Vibrio sp. S234-5]MBE4605790.1 hypothetical protein [Vibrio navarrensis]